MGNQLTTSTQKVVSRTALAMMLVLTLALMATTPAIAVVPPQLTHGTAVVDGSDAEWNLTDDFFAYMYRADNPNKPIESILYMRYDCATSTGYALVLAQTGVDVLMQPSDAFVRLGNSPKLVDGNAATFAWVQPNTQTGRAQGWEASFSLAPGSYPNLNVYTQVFDEESQTSAAADRSIPISIVCPVMTLTETPTLTGPSFGSCYNPEDQVFRLTVVNKATVAAYIGYDIYGKANSFVNLGRFDAGESKVFTVSEEGTLRKFISYDGQQWQQKGGTHVLSVAGHTTNNLLCKGSVSACKFNDLNGNGVQDANEPSISDWQMSIYAGEIEDGEQPIASGVTNEDGFINFERLLPGQYTVCEGAVEGWLPTVSLCQSVTVLSEQETSVTFGNVRGGRIIVDKITDPAGAEDIFTFNLSKGAATTTFTLADASTPFDSGLILPGAYSIAELATEGWTLTDVTCMSVNENANVSELPNPVTISLQPGQVVQCTFTNTQDTPTETPTETNTPEPTPTDPTNTPEPTPTDPTNTPEPTPTDPTNTPEPTPTDPTNTPEPTPTDPTNTPEPTPTEDAPTAILSSECIVGEAGSWRYEWTVMVSRDDNYLVRFLDLNGNQVASREVAFRGDTPTPFTFEGDVTMLGRVEVLFGAALLAFDNGPFTSCAPPPPPAVGSLTVTKAVVWNEVAVTPVTFMICIQGASFPNGNEAGACTTFNENGGNHTWTDLVPGMYTITETGVDTDLWTVTGSGVSVEVVADAEATYTVTNTAIDVGGEGETPTALDPEDEPVVGVTSWIFLPTVVR